MKQITQGTEYVKSATVSNVFAGTNGLKLGSSKDVGSFSITLNQAYKITNVVVNAAQYNTSDGAKISCGSTKDNAVVSNTALAASLTECSFDWSGADVSTIYVATSQKRAYVSSIVITYSTTSQTYKVTVESSDENKGSVFLTDKEFNDEQTETSFAAGTKLGVMALADDGYEFVNWTLDPADAGVLVDPTAEETVFTVGNKDVTITANFQQVVTKYDISLTNPQDPDTKEVLATIETKVAGSTADKAAENDEVTLTLKDVKAGYELDQWVVLEDGEESKPITVADNKFTMPAAKVTVSATLKQQTPATITLSENGAETPFADGTAHYAGSKITLPTSAGGNCNKSVSFVGWSEVEITNSATQPATHFYAPGATYTIQNQSTKLYAVYAKTTLGVFRKVTTTPADWTGEYLIVCEAENVVFDGSIDGDFDVANNNQSVTIDNGTIALADGQDYTFFIAKSGNGYTLSKSGYYIGGASSNGLSCSKTKTYIHTTLSLQTQQMQQFKLQIRQVFCVSIMMQTLDDSDIIQVTQQGSPSPYI